MANVLFDRLGKKDFILKDIELPRLNDEVFFDDTTYKVVLMKHFPEGGKGVEVYKKIKFPFIRISLKEI